MIRTLSDTGWSATFARPSGYFMPVLPMSVRTVPLGGIKSKKIPIVQPNLTFLIKKK
jgi:hypothetical protein